MSMRVLIVPEDVRKDQYLLKPLFVRLFRSLGKSAARVEVCQDPRLGGVVEALKTERLAEIVAQYRGMIDVFVLCVDRDGDVNRRQRLDRIEREFDHGKGFLAENAWEELETWTLAGLTLPDEWRWDEVRAAVDVKERYFDELARRRGLSNAPGGGRKRLGEEAARWIDAIRRKCPEDFDDLAGRIRTVLDGMVP